MTATAPTTPPNTSARFEVSFGLPAIAALSVSALALFVAPPASAWNSTLYPTSWTPPASSFETSRMIQDFSYAGYRRGDVPLPDVTGPVYNVVTGYGADPTGAINSTVAIQNAIDAASVGGGVVYLPAGTFKVSPQGSNIYALKIGANNVILRGAGRTQTFLLNDSYLMRGKRIIMVQGANSSWGVLDGSPQPAITADLLTPTTQIPVASVAGFAAGDAVILCADATADFFDEHNMLDVWGAYSAELRGVLFQRQIAAIDPVANVLTVDVPIRYYLKTRDNARVYKVKTHVEEVGLEDFSIGNREHANAGTNTGWADLDFDTAGTGAYDVHGSTAVEFRHARNCWMTGVATYRPAVNTLKNSHLLSMGVRLSYSRFITVQDCDFQRPLYGGGGGNGYMYSLAYTNECLLLNCAARYCRHGFSFTQMGTSGNVIHGGISQDTGRKAAGDGTTDAKGCDHHQWLSQSNLVDCVQFNRDFATAHYRVNLSDPLHGITAVHSVFWNLEGHAYHNDGSSNYVARSEQGRYGYVVGTRGPANAISTLADAPTRTAPVDHTEGQGQGDTLAPFSLYLDQLGRRLGVPLPPPPPASVTVTQGQSQATLTWTASTGATSYTVKRSDTDGWPYTTLASGITGTSYVDTTITPGVTYYYVAAAADSSGVGLNSTQVVSQPPPLDLPEYILDNTDAAGVTFLGSWAASTTTPGYYGTNYVSDGNTGATGGKSVRFTPNLGSTMYEVYLRWTAGSNRASNTPVDVTHAGGTQTFSVNQRLNNGAWVLLGIFTFDIGTSGNVTVRNDGANGYVIADAVKFVRVEPPPAAPGSLTATAGRKKITLAWTDNSANEDGFKIERSTNGLDFAQATTLAANLTSYTNTDLTRCTTYWYRVRAYNATGDSAYSPIASATTK